MCKILFLILLLLPINCNAFKFIPSQEVVLVAEQYLDVRERTNHNDNPIITKWLKNCGLGAGNSYCSAAVVSWYKETYEKNNQKSPYPMYASVARFASHCVKNQLNFKVISTKKMQWNIDGPQQGDIVSFKHGSSTFSGFNYKGHMELLAYVNDKKLDTIGANTKMGEGGDQSGSELGDLTYGLEGVYQRTPCTLR